MITTRILWRATPAWVKWLIAGAVVLSMAYGAGYMAKGRKAAEEAAQARSETLERIEDADTGLDGVSDADIDDRLRSLGE